MAQGALCFGNYSQWEPQRYILISFLFLLLLHKHPHIFSMVRLSIIKFASIRILMGTSLSLARCESPRQWPGSFSSPGN